MRPLTSLARAGVTFTRVACAPDDTLDPADVAAAMGPKTRLVIMTHASNVCGTILPLAEVGAIAQRTRLCMVGGIRDMILFRESKLLLGFVAILGLAMGAAFCHNFGLASSADGTTPAGRVAVVAGLVVVVAIAVANTFGRKR